MDAIITKLLQESPYVAALLILTLINYRSIERITRDFTNTIKSRDAIFMNMMQKQADKLDAIDLRHAAHAEEMTAGLNAMYKAAGTKRPTRRKTDKKNPNTQ